MPRPRRASKAPKRSAPLPRIHGHTPPPPEPIPDPVPAQIARINEISALARTTWFGLLAYLAFVGVTLLGVEDADFFVPARQTQLPLVNVAIPTSSFFWFAPALGAALYAYLHLQLVKLWEALAAPSPEIDGKPLSERVYPWLISDYALARRTDGALKHRPLAALSRIVTWWLVWAAAPLILAGFWWRSMPRHDEWMTLGIAAAMMLAVYVGLTSNWRATILLRKNGRLNSRKTPWQGWLRRALFVVLCLCVLALSWARTEGGIDHRFDQIVAVWNSAMRDIPARQIYHTCPDDPVRPADLIGPNNKAAYCFFRNGEAKERAELQEAIVRNLPFIWPLDQMTESFAASWTGQAIASDSDWDLFPRAELAGVNLVPNPGNLLDHNTERRRFRKIWCQRQGIALEACGRLYTKAEPAPEHLDRRRLDWCKKSKRAILTADCQRFFDALDAEFRTEWDQLWSSRTANLGDLDLSGADLRRANLNSAFLIGVNLNNARLEGATSAMRERSARTSGRHTSNRRPYLRA
ncbi:MAG: pentapeptide repeat-containing protein [Paracoccaceae bacterium]